MLLAEEQSPDNDCRNVTRAALRWRPCWACCAACCGYAVPPHRPSSDAFFQPCRGQDASKASREKLSSSGWWTGSLPPPTKQQLLPRHKHDRPRPPPPRFPHLHHSPAAVSLCNAKHCQGLAGHRGGRQEGRAVAALRQDQLSQAWPAAQLAENDTSHRYEPILPGMQPSHDSTPLPARQHLSHTPTRCTMPPMNTTPRHPVGHPTASTAQHTHRLQGCSRCHGRQRPRWSRCGRSPAGW